jgi:hypothetical protein
MVSGVNVYRFIKEIDVYDILVCTGGRVGEASALDKDDQQLIYREEPSEYVVYIHTNMSRT